MTQVSISKWDKNMINNNVILHVGLPRTATTFLQSQILQKIPNYNIIKDKQTLVKNLQQQYYEKNIIITNEMFSMIPDRYELVNKIKQYYPQTKLLLGIRDYPTILHKLYNHLVQHGLCETRETWTKRQPKHMKKYIKYLKEIFPNNYIYKFEDFKKNPDDIITNICELIKCKKPKYINKKINKTTMDDKNIEFIRKTNMLCQSKYNKNGWIPRHIITQIWTGKNEIIFDIKHPTYKQITFTEQELNNG